MLHRASAPYLHAVGHKVAFQSGCHLARVVGNGKNAPAAFHHGGHTSPIKKRDYILHEKARESTVEKPPCLTKVRDKVGKAGFIRDVAAPFAGQTQLVAQAWRLLQQQNSHTAFCSSARSHHA
jgi:hypothetical protein